MPAGPLSRLGSTITSGDRPHHTWPPTGHPQDAHRSRPAPPPAKTADRLRIWAVAAAGGHAGGWAPAGAGRGPVWAGAAVRPGWPGWRAMAQGGLVRVALW